MSSSRPLLVVTSALLATAVGIACSSFGSDSPTTSETPDAGADVTALDASSATDASDATTTGSACPTGDMVAVSSFHVDRTEVTVAAWNCVVAELDGGTLDAGIPDCPVGAILPSPAAQNLPVTNVTFCQARAFCNWVGKHLCGQVGGGTLDPSAAASPISESYAACALAGAPANCNTDSDGGPRAAAAGTCQSGSGTLDQVGNVWEWIDTVHDGGSAPAALFSGGAYETITPTCATLGGAGLSFAAGDVGFRCCSSP